MNNEPKHLPIKEFRELGYLQEVNRQFLHPLGLALEISIDDTGIESISGIWDYRNDPEGIIYDLKSSNSDRIEKFTKKSLFVKAEQERIGKQRSELLGYVIEPIG
jgi:hypothetical protein